jgi:hypothetical protein
MFSLPVFVNGILIHRFDAGLPVALCARPAMEGRDGQIRQVVPA